MKVLFIGDIVGSPGRRIVVESVRALAAEHAAELVIANCENAAAGFGITPALAQELLEAGVDVLTGGNHTFDRKDILPFFEENNVAIETVLSDNGREFCGRPDHHPYELFLQLEGIDHRTTQVRRPQSNGYLERFHRTLLDEHLRIQGRTTFYEDIVQMQNDLDGFLQRYNHDRPHQGRGMKGRTPFKAFLEGRPKPSDKPQTEPSAA